MARRESYNHNQFVFHCAGTCAASGLTDLANILKILFDERGLFGVKGQYFEVVYTVRKITAILLQSAEAYRTSQLLSRISINSVFVATIIIHCWSTPLINHTFKHNRSLVRLLCIGLYLLMIFITGLGTPLLVSIPYLYQYDFSVSDFPLYLYMDDAWYINMISELRTVFISSWSNLISELTLSITLLLCFSDVKALILSSKDLTLQNTRKKRNSVTIWKRKVVHSDSGDRPLKSLSISPQLSEVLQSKPQASPSQVSYNAYMRLIKLMHIFMVVWGVLILVLHTRVAFRLLPRFCVHELRPWFTSKTGCTLLIVNCSAFTNVTGNMAELTDALSGLDEQMLTKIEIHDCAFVEIPPAIQRFSQLGGLLVSNSILARWDIDAALTAKTHPKLSFFASNEINLTGIPMGLLSPDFPKQVTAIEFAYTNLTTLTDDIGDVWPVNDVFISMDYSQLTSIPRGLLKASTRSLSLVGNKIWVLTNELLTNPAGTFLWLGDNPFVELPSGVVPSKLIESIDISYSQIEFLPEWADAVFLNEYLWLQGVLLFVNYFSKPAAIIIRLLTTLLHWMRFKPAD